MPLVSQFLSLSLSFPIMKIGELNRMYGPGGAQGFQGLQALK